MVQEGVLIYFLWIVIFTITRHVVNTDQLFAFLASQVSAVTSKFFCSHLSTKEKERTIFLPVQPLNNSAFYCGDIVLLSSVCLIVDPTHRFCCSVISEYDLLCFVIFYYYCFLLNKADANFQEENKTHTHKKPLKNTM